MERSKQEEKIRNVLGKLQKSADEWIEIGRLGFRLKLAGIDFNHSGAANLKEFLALFPEVVEIKQSNDSISFVRLLNANVSEITNEEEIVPKTPVSLPENNQEHTQPIATNHIPKKEILDNDSEPITEQNETNASSESSFSEDQKILEELDQLFAGQNSGKQSPEEGLNKSNPEPTKASGTSSAERKTQAETLLQIVKDLESTEDGWVDFAQIGAAAKNSGIDYTNSGTQKLRSFLESFSDIFEFTDYVEGEKPPVYYARIPRSTNHVSKTPVSASRIEKEPTRQRELDSLPEKLFEKIFSIAFIKNGPAAFRAIQRIANTTVDHDELSSAILEENRAGKRIYIEYVPTLLVTQPSFNADANVIGKMIETPYFDRSNERILAFFTYNSYFKNWAGIWFSTESNIRENFNKFLEDNVTPDNQSPHFDSTDFEKFFIANYEKPTNEPYYSSPVSKTIHPVTADYPTEKQEHDINNFYRILQHIGSLNNAPIALDILKKKVKQDFNYDDLAEAIVKEDEDDKTIYIERRGDQISTADSFNPNNHIIGKMLETPYSEENGDKIFAYFTYIPQTKKWKGIYFSTQDYILTRQQRYRIGLFEFRSLEEANNFIYNLHDNLLRGEKWAFSGKLDPNKTSYPILESYLAHYTRKLFYETNNPNHQNYRKAVFSTDGKYCLFNTGLLDSVANEQYIYGEVQYGSNRYVKTIRNPVFKTSGSKLAELGFENQKPKMLTFFKNFEELLYDPNAEVDFNDSTKILHIIKDNISRFPEEFQQDIRDGKEQLIIGMLKQATLAAAKIAERNYKYVVHQWRQTDNKIHLLLPIYLEQDYSKQPDFTLVLTKVGKYYVPETILTLRMAYSDARLVCRPDVTWLQAERIEASYDLEDPDDIEDDDDDLNIEA